MFCDRSSQCYIGGVLMINILFKRDFAIEQNLFYYRSLMTVWDEGKGWNRLGDDKVCLLAHSNGTKCITYAHSIS